MKNKLWLWVALSIFTFPMMAQAVEDPGRQSQSINQRIVTGTIDEISNSKITVKTDGGKNRVFTIDPSEQSDYVNRGLKKGDRISLSYDHLGQIIGVDKLKKTGGEKMIPGSQEPNR